MLAPKQTIARASVNLRREGATATLWYFNFERPIILTTDSRNKKALPEYPHRGYSGSAFITTNAVVGGTCRSSGCVNDAVYLVMVKK